MKTANRHILTGILTVIVTACLPLTLTAGSDFSGGPGDARTGAPGEGLCTDCHTSFAVNSGNGNFQLLGIPGTMSPGQTITITVQLQDPGQQRWGFELTALDDNTAGANGAGVFTVTDAVNTQLSDNIDPNRDYIKHTSTGTQNGTADGPVTWEFDWTAPATEGMVYFYAAGNAADGSGSSGDYIYTTSSSVTIAAATIPTTTTAGLLVLAAFIVLAAVTVIRTRGQATT